MKVEEMSTKVLDMAQEMQEGIVRLVQYDLILNDYTVWLDHHSQKVVIPRQELELFEVKGSLNHYIGKKLQFVLTDFDEKRKIHLGTCKPVKTRQRDDLIESLQQGEAFEARIVRLVYFGAYLEIAGIPVILRNRDFADDYTTVADIHDMGDTIQVKLLKISQNGKINVQAVSKYESPSKITIEDFLPHTVVYGIVRNVKPWACFVNIAPNLDAICPIPPYINVKEGMKVAFRINQVKPEEKKIRGKIIKEIE